MARALLRHEYQMGLEVYALEEDQAEEALKSLIEAWDQAFVEWSMTHGDDLRDKGVALMVGHVNRLTSITDDDETEIGVMV